MIETFSELIENSFNESCKKCLGCNEAFDENELEEEKVYCNFCLKKMISMINKRF